MQGNNSGPNAAQIQAPVDGGNANDGDDEQPNQSNDSNDQDDGAEADAEADDDVGANLKPDFESGVPNLMPLAQRINKPTGFSNAVCNFNSHV